MAGAHATRQYDDAGRDDAGTRVIVASVAPCRTVEVPCVSLRWPMT